MFEIERARVLRLPEGAYISIRTFEEGSWSALDVHLVHPSGKDELLCTVEYDEGKGLRAMTYDDVHEEPIFTRHVKLFPWEEVPEDA